MANEVSTETRQLQTPDDEVPPIQLSLESAMRETWVVQNWESCTKLPEFAREAMARIDDIQQGLCCIAGLLTADYVNKKDVEWNSGVEYAPLSLTTVERLQSAQRVLMRDLAHEIDALSDISRGAKS